MRQITSVNRIGTIALPQINADSYLRATHDRLPLLFGIAVRQSATLTNGNLIERYAHTALVKWHACITHSRQNPPQVRVGREKCRLRARLSTLLAVWAGLCQRLGPRPLNIADQRQVHHRARGLEHGLIGQFLLGQLGDEFGDVGVLGLAERLARVLRKGVDHGAGRRHPVFPGAHRGGHTV